MQNRLLGTAGWPCFVAAVWLLVACADKKGERGVPQHPLVVLVLPLGDVPQRHLDSVKVAIQREHGARVHVCGKEAIPEHAFTDVRGPRYRADTLIAWLRDHRPDSVDHVMGIISKDISATKRDLSGGIKEPSWKYADYGIFGLGYVGGASSVVSTYRLGSSTRPQFFDRLMKITVHEIGHNRALPHCPDTTCVMRDVVERMASIDRAGRRMCGKCRERLAY